MNHPRIVLLAALIVIIAFVAPTSFAQDTSNFPYMNPKLSPEERAADLVHRMTLEEKASQLVNQARAIPRLEIPAYDWWSEALHGVIADGATEFPEPIGLAATFDVPRIHEMATAIGIEGRIKHVQPERAGHSNIFEGLDFWAPNVNIFRDPRWGRGQETYGEDPFLSARLAVAFVTGMQGDDPALLPRHLHAQTLRRSQRPRTHAPLRRRGRQQARRRRHLSAGIPRRRRRRPRGVGHVRLQRDQRRARLREPVPAAAHSARRMGIPGLCGLRLRRRARHLQRPPLPPDAAAGLGDLAAARHGQRMHRLRQSNDDHDYRPYIDAVQQGYLPESAVDTALMRLFTARIRLGMFDPPAMVPYIEDRRETTRQRRASRAGPPHRQ